LHVTKLRFQNDHEICIAHYQSMKDHSQQHCMQIIRMDQSGSADMLCARDGTRSLGHCDKSQPGRVRSRVKSMCIQFISF